MSVDELLRSAVTRLGVVRVSSALNPLLWITALVVISAWGCAWLFRDDPILKYGFAGFGASSVFFYLFHYTRFAFTDPDRLQSEEYLSRRQEFSILERKGVQGPEQIAPTRNDPLTIESEALPQSSRGDGQ